MAPWPTAPKRPFTRLERLISRISQHGLFSRCWVICTVGSTSRRVYSKTCRRLSVVYDYGHRCLYIPLSFLSLISLFATSSAPCMHTAIEWSGSKK